MKKSYSLLAQQAKERSKPQQMKQKEKRLMKLKEKQNKRLARLLPSANCWNKWNESKDDETKANEQSLVEWSSAAVEGPLAHNPQTTQAH